MSDYCAVTTRTALNREVFQKVNSEVEKKHYIFHIRTFIFILVFCRFIELSHYYYYSTPLT
jgi:hypothetical protein